jgi:hypothetical protein
LKPLRSKSSSSAVLARLPRDAGRQVDLHAASVGEPGQRIGRDLLEQALFSRSLIASRTITAVIVAAQRTVERPLVR